MYITLVLQHSTHNDANKRDLVEDKRKASKNSPVLKRNHSQPYNYHPIALTSVLSRVFESGLSSKIWK